MNLRTQYPRSVKDRLGPYVHLPRIIDKCRAKLAGTLGEYIYPCPLDQRFLDFTEISPEYLLSAVKTRTDQEMLTWVAEHAKIRREEEIQEWNQMMLNRGPDTEEKWNFFLKVRNSIDPKRTDITTWPDLLDLEEGREVPSRK